MKLRVFDNSNCGIVSNPETNLRINEMTGLFTINKEAALMMGIGQMDRICILQNKESPFEFYLHVNQHPNSFVLRNHANLTASFINEAMATLLLDKGKVINRSTRQNRRGIFIIADPVMDDGLKLYKIFLGYTHSK